MAAARMAMLRQQIRKDVIQNAIAKPLPEHQSTQFFLSPQLTTCHSLPVASCLFLLLNPSSGTMTRPCVNPLVHF